MAIRAVCFDLDDTLLWDDRSVKEAFQAVCKLAAEKYTALDPEALEAAVRKEARALYESYETFPFTQRIGINPFEGLWARFEDGDEPNFKKLHELAPVYRTESWTRGLRAFGLEDREFGALLGEKFGEERRSRPLTYEETFTILDALKGKYKLLLLTNGSPSLQNEKLNGVPQIRGYFDHIVISGAFGAGKPDPSIFDHALGLLGVEGNEALMVGDKLTTDIKGGNGAGMTTVWINRHGMEPSADIVPTHEITNLMDIVRIIAGING